MVADPQVDGECPEWDDLVGDEVAPGVAAIVIQGKSSVVLVLDVFIDVRHSPEIAEVPIEIDLMPARPLRNKRHDHIAAVPRITGDGEAPDPL